jgi:transposase
MLGRENRQCSLFDSDSVCAHLIDKENFHAKMREYAPSIISDDDFAEIYCLTNGRPSVPPARLVKVLILQYHDNLPDRQALNTVRFNILWEYALNVPLDYAGFDASLLTVFRARLLCHNQERLLFRKTLALAREVGLLQASSIRSLIALPCWDEAQSRMPVDSSGAVFAKPYASWTKRGVLASSPGFFPRILTRKRGKTTGLLRLLREKRISYRAPIQA